MKISYESFRTMAWQILNDIDGAMNIKANFEMKLWIAYRDTAKEIRDVMEECQSEIVTETEGTELFFKQEKEWRELRDKANLLYHDIKYILQNMVEINGVQMKAGQIYSHPMYDQHFKIREIVQDQDDLEDSLIHGVYVDPQDYTDEGREVHHRAWHILEEWSLEGEE
ncbi:hypothetical protein [Risungbinella massiliensis]|uniref:hypothetical protein n=1 Tax=Risungbinella massiliensis TaxID=1329796 RepID=UPI0005CBAC82|nr:hypothetical protein [Risungbinella massiliensis]